MSWCLGRQQARAALSSRLAGAQHIPRQQAQLQGSGWGEPGVAGRGAEGAEGAEGAMLGVRQLGVGALTWLWEMWGVIGTTV